MPRDHAEKARPSPKTPHPLVTVSLTSSVWFQPLIVLAKEPAALSVADSMKDFVRVVGKAIDLIKDPSQIGLYRDPIFLARTQFEILAEARPKHHV